MWKRILLACLAGLSVIIVISVCRGVNSFVHDIYTSNNPYLEISSYYNEGDSFKLKDIFRFEFAKAYIISDYSLTGTEINDKYDLDIKNIKLGVMSGTVQNENLVRIVFVDDNNNFIMDCCYNKSSEFIITDEEITVYPNTLFKISGYSYAVDTDSEASRVFICDVLNLKEGDRLRSQN